jgi:GWxTD domain-containing protein
MNPFDSPITAAVGRALAHFIWEGAALALLFGAALACLRRASSQARYLAACSALAAMAAAFAITCAIEVNGVRTIQLAEPAARFAIAAVHGIGGGAPVERPRGNEPLWNWIVPVWMAGVLVFALRGAGGWMNVRRMRSRAVIGAGEYWEARLRELAARMGVTRAVGLLESGVAHAPVLIGLLKPVILLPAGLATGLRPEQVEAILLHELAHVRRHDYLVNLLQTAVEGLLFYHPAVWWAGRVARRERENCCDDAVVALNGNAFLYAETLARLAGVRPAEPALASTGGDLAGRVRRLLRPADAPGVPAGAVVAVGALLLGSAAVLAGWQTPAAQPASRPVAQRKSEPQNRPAETQSQSGYATTADPYRKWLTEDVAYIISDEERQAFKMLGSNPEREHFIEQFWDRRDPTPGTPENEFKMEYYRRIAYANDRFTTSIPGWKTDRGLIYIVHGPPDEKEVHPSGDGNPPGAPWEAWRYKAFDAQGEMVVAFTDTERTGDFRLDLTRSAMRQGKAVLILGPLSQSSEITATNGRAADTRGLAARLVLPSTASRGGGAPRDLAVSPGVPESNGPFVIHRSPGGGAEVRVFPSGSVAIGAPIADGRFATVLLSQVMHTGLVPVFHDRQVKPPVYDKTVALQPGTYRLEITIEGDGPPVTERVDFQVKAAAVR